MIASPGAPSHLHDNIGRRVSLVCLGKRGLDFVRPCAHARFRGPGSVWSSYNGDVENDYRNGTGTFTFPEGSVYTGQYKDDMKVPFF